MCVRLFVCVCAYVCVYMCACVYVFACTCMYVHVLEYIFKRPLVNKLSLQEKMLVGVDVCYISNYINLVIGTTIPSQCNTGRGSGYGRG